MGTEDAPGSSGILAPLAVVPDVQRQGVGGLLLQAGLRLLGVSGIRLVFLAGYPDYYTRHGFEPAYPYGFTPPFPVSPTEAWMVHSLQPGVLGATGGLVICATAMNKVEHWQE